MTPRPNAAPRRYEWRQTIRINTCTVSMTAEMTQAEAWHWLTATGAGLRDYASYSVRVECV